MSAMGSILLLNMILKIYRDRSVLGIDRAEAIIKKIHSQTRVTGILRLDVSLDILVFCTVSNCNHYVTKYYFGLADL